VGCETLNDQERNHSVEDVIVHNIEHHKVQMI